MKYLKTIITLLLISVTSITSYGQTDIAQEWVLGKKNTIIKIEKQNDNNYEGKIIASDNPKVILGKLMVKELKSKNGKWKGKLFSPKKKEWYDAEFTPKENVLEVKVKAGFFSKTIEWTKKES
ncbi:hypothetical protein SAMN04489761_0895 [Tenacibaculum sp. MAR_2009_124]|uniref:DUF2147 domain-containing protein n=1 Tax=Tenacibaculum sp. MAR_2009_124 TaxID=1250059 RepID=UPI00089D26E6|nr:DUF2147 domain-containing protein [Tenacibaculum sp. MAR_2009_124]SEB46832.1 hypothetical protein SAMN04489761_0895 [Tenacibaculum sp. MAR_2009_124]